VDFDCVAKTVKGEANNVFELIMIKSSRS